VRALICDAFGPIDALRIGDVPDPEPRADEVLIDVACAGAGFADGLVVQGRHVARPAFPFTPGSELAGTVRAVGRDVANIAIGARVMAFVPRGAFAERVAAPAARVFPLPDSVPFAAGAAGLVSYGTALHALSDRGRIASQETLLVLAAAGSTGLAAVEIGALLGARVIAAASTPEKQALALRKGAAEAIDYATGDFRETLRQVAPDGLDLVFDPVGGQAAETVARALARCGRHLIIGFASGDMPRLAANLYLVKQAEAIGVLWGEPRNLATQGANIARITGWMAEGKLSPEIGATFPLEQAADALQAVAMRRIGGKAIVAIG
jgi:NADPH:quinone reductase